MYEEYKKHFQIPVAISRGYIAKGTDENELLSWMTLSNRPRKKTKLENIKRKLKYSKMVRC